MGEQMKLVGKYIVSGIVAIIPLWITWLVIEFIFRKLLAVGAPIVESLRGALSRLSPEIPAHVNWPIAEKILAVALTLIIFYCVGWAANRVFGRRILAIVENAIERVPLVKTIYGGIRKLISTLEGQPEGGQQRVVLINFPSEEMKTVGILTQVMEEIDTGRTLAIVYVPTTPNPTSGYVEIVPIERVVATDWTLDEAMNFIVSAGAVAPARPIRYTDELHRESGPALLPEPKAVTR
jgi:uncharacterized membrane protein